MMSARQFERILLPATYLLLPPWDMSSTHFVVEIIILALMREMTSKVLTDQGPALRQPGFCTIYESEDELVEQESKFGTQGVIG